MATPMTWPSFTYGHFVPPHISPALGSGAVTSGRSPASVLRELARDTVGAALRAEDAEVAVDGEARTMLRRACEAARANDARVEHLLVLLKDAWRELPPARLRARFEGQARIERLVTLCIKEYYGTTGHPQ